MDFQSEIFFTILLAFVTTFLFKKIAFVSSDSNVKDEDEASATNFEEEHAQSQPSNVKISGRKIEYGAGPVILEEELAKSQPSDVEISDQNIAYEAGSVILEEPAKSRPSNVEISDQNITDEAGPVILEEELAKSQPSNVENSDQNIAYEAGPVILEEELAKSQPSNVEISDRNVADEAGSVIFEEGWEGIEKSDTAKLFGKASEFMNSSLGKEAFSELNNDIQMQILSLHKIALEGPCYDSSSSGQWMNTEEAMEKYLSLISDNIPNWRNPKEEGLWR